jgi:hypothetical protein
MALLNKADLHPRLNKVTLDSSKRNVVGYFGGPGPVWKTKGNGGVHDSIERR